MAGFSSLNIGVLGLQAASTALNTTAHNLSNVYTKGYVKQTAVFSDYSYKNVGNFVNGKMLSGLGVYVNATSHVRDILLDKAYREESGREGFYSAQYSVVEEVETILGELEGTTFQEEVEDLWDATNELAKDPGNNVSRAEFVMASEKFLDRATSIYQDFINYQKTLDQEIKNTVIDINNLGDKINELNKQISSVEAAGIEFANDLRDQRDNAIDELSNLVKVSYTEEKNGRVSVKAEGIPFVTSDAVFYMDTIQLSGAEGSTYITAVWPQIDHSRVFNLNAEEISTDKNNDLGKLKGLLLSRGEYVADYTDVPKQDNFATAADYYTAVDKYNSEVDNCAIMKTQALFDTLINGIVTAVNNVLSPTTSASVTVGGVTTTMKVLDVANCSYGDDGTLPAEEVFSRLDTQRYNTIVDDFGDTYYVYNNTNIFGGTSLYTCSNLKMNQTILEDYTKLPLMTLEGEVDMEKAEKLVKIWEDSFTNVDPGNLTEKNFKSYYNEIVYEIANMGSMFNSIAVNQGSAVSGLETSRQSIMGVASEEELTNMIKFQSAYGAASRYINVIDQMLEHLVTNL